MTNEKEVKAKTIVAQGLRDWRGTYTAFQEFAAQLLGSRKRITTVDKREDALRKALKTRKSDFFVQEVAFNFSRSMPIEGISNAPDDTPSSKAQQQRSAENEHKLNRHLHQVNTRRTHAFVVKNDSPTPANVLLVMIFKTHGTNTRELLSNHSVATISFHCLERIVERLGVETIEAAIKEILPALVWLESSGSELAVRPPYSFAAGGMKRHIPTPNGALLLTTTVAPSYYGKPQQDCTLVTWIHEKQFKKSQRVTRREFIFTHMVNYWLSDPNRTASLEGLRNDILAIESSHGVEEVTINLHGERFPAREFLAALEKGEYLDYVIDFERDAPAKRTA
ncbi:hypothetical protein HU735_20760 [Pseudomonas sp. BW16M2]|uniref:hypothetical protein n=1 Tax=Pseudomonas sp. BW16M2 TaxID=2745489 RepID=UPI0016468A93|nr:hypothetical protein [Pseudomonas sp. BW16M2]MBC3437856.1 hypothetical protein [Pseudomonas sp. BW16M2]